MLLEFLFHEFQFRKSSRGYHGIEGVNYDWPEGLWNQAVESYLASAGRGTEDKAILTKIQNVDDLEAQLEANH